MSEQEIPDVMEGQPCPMCNKKTLTLREIKKEIPFFGTVYVFSMDCSNCGYHMADLEKEEEGKPVKYTFEVTEEKDLNIRIVKSSQATIKIPRIVTISPGPASNGYVTNIESIINKVKKIIEEQKTDDDPAVRKKAKNLLKKLQNVLWGREKLKIIIEDPTGNSAIISDKAIKGKL